MVRYPNFKLIAGSNDITENIRANMMDIGFEDREGSESDEIIVRVHGIYAKPYFGDSLELWLGYGEELWKCGSFLVQTCERDYKGHTTEVRATAVDFASPIKVKKTRTWQNTDIFGIAGTIASENGLRLSTSGSTMSVGSRLQDNVSDLDFLYGLCFENGYLMAVKDGALVVTAKDGKVGEGSANITPKNGALPRAVVALTECSSLVITEANRHAYDAVAVEWQDIQSGKTKSIKVGNGENLYTQRVAEPKSDREAYRVAESKLNELQKGGINGRIECDLREIKAGGKLVLSGVDGYEDTEFSIKSVSHKLTPTTCSTSVEFEG